MPADVRFAELRRVLSQKNYVLHRVSGSHHIFAKPGVPHLSIPVHKNKVKYVYYKQAINAP
jgi:predicted RNA binding protein YcfA (HicA-like mRNA interferase family)